MRLKLLLIAALLDNRITFRLGEIQYHRLSKQIKPLYFADSVGGGLDGVEDDERLALSLQAGLCDDFHDGAIVFEDFGERFFQRVDLDFLGQVLDLDVQWSERCAGASQEGTNVDSVKQVLAEVNVWGMGGRYVSFGGWVGPDGTAGCAPMVRDVQDAEMALWLD